MEEILIGVVVLIAIAQLLLLIAYWKSFKYFVLWVYWIIRYYIFTKLGEKYNHKRCFASFMMLHFKEQLNKF